MSRFKYNKPSRDNTNEILGILGTSQNTPGNLEIDADKLDNLQYNTLVAKDTIQQELETDINFSTDYITTPSITSHGNGSTLATAPFTSSPYFRDTTSFSLNQTSATWQISTTGDNTFSSNIVEESVLDRFNLTTYYPNGLSPSTTYYIRVRYESRNVKSSFSPIVQFITSANYARIEKPTITILGNNKYDTYTRPMFEISTLNVLSGSANVVSIELKALEVYDTYGDFGLIVRHSETKLASDVTKNLKIFKIPYNKVLQQRHYYVTVKIITDNGESQTAGIDINPGPYNIMWQPFPSLIEPTEGHALVTLPISKRVVCIGGVNGSGTYNNSMYIIDPSIESGWLRFTTSPDIITKMAASAYAYGGQEHIIITGGITPGGTLSSKCFQYTLGAGTGLVQIASLPIAVYEHRQTVLDQSGKVVVYGGRKTTNTNVNNPIAFTYNHELPTPTWTNTAFKNNVASRDMAIAPIKGTDDLMVISGRYYDSATSTYIQSLKKDIVSPLEPVIANQWKPAMQPDLLSSSVNSEAVTLANGSIFLARFQNNQLAPGETETTDNDTWNQRGVIIHTHESIPDERISTNIIRYYHVGYSFEITLLGDGRILLVGGRDQYNRALSVCHTLTL